MSTKKTTTTVVVLPEIEFKVMRVTLIGETPLVTNPFSEKAKRQIEIKQQSEATAKKHGIRNPWEDFIHSLYWLTPPPAEYTQEAFDAACKAGARFGFHAGGIKNSAISAAVRRKLVKDKPTGRGLFHIITSEQDTVHFTNCVEILTGAPPKMRRDCLSAYKCGADMRYRPQFDNWRMEFDVRFDAGTITPEKILMWFKLGGFASGLGENRAEKGEGWGSYKLG